MLSEKNSTTTVLENTMGAGQAFTFDPEAMAQLMQILTNMYSDPENAVIREYSVNAYDAHIEAGVTRPIEITLPTWEKPFYVIQDYGVGLTVDELVHLFSSYGASTKRNTNSQVGTFGIGSKSALTYTSLFTVEAVKNGVRSRVNISLNDDGIGDITVVDTCATDDHNGVKVIVPVRKHNTFATKSKDFFRFWEPGTVLIDGDEPEYIDGDELSPNIYAITGTTSYIVMGNVAYPLSADRFTTDVSFVARVGIGDVSIAPSREALYYNPKTQNVVNAIAETVNSTLLQKVEADLATSANYVEAFKRYQKWCGRLSAFLQVMPKVRYKGTKFTTYVKLDCLDYSVEGYNNKAFTLHSVFASSLYNRSFIIYGFPSKSLSGTIKAKISEYINSNNLDFQNVYLVKDKPTGIYFDGIPMVDYQTIKAINIITPGLASSTKIKGSWYKFDSQSYRPIEITVLDTSLPIIYVSASDYKYRVSDYDMQSLLNDLPADVQFLKLEKNRWTKFKREFPSAMHVSDWVHKQFNAMILHLGDDYVVRYYMETAAVNLLKQLNSDLINDPGLINDIRIANLNNKINNFLKAYHLFYRYIKRLPDNVPQSKYKFSYNTYPLIEYIDGQMSDAAVTDLINYFNMVYNERLDTGADV